jgi:hypothetical protein
MIFINTNAIKPYILEAYTGKRPEIDRFSKRSCSFHGFAHDNKYLVFIQYLGQYPANDEENITHKKVLQALHLGNKIK